jgi:phosphonate transport system ATP-binding protein
MADAGTLPPLVARTDCAEVVYPNGTRGLHACSLEFRAGEFVVLLGASGAGKSTLLRLLNGLATPTGGAVLDAHAQSLAERGVLRRHRRRTGMVFQQHHLIDRLSVLQNVLIGRLGSRSLASSLLPWRRTDKCLALSALARVDLLERALQRADALSGGQQQRVGIARALIQAPTLLLADEPVASLDPATAERLMNLLGTICRADGMALIVSLHQVELALRHADRIVGLKDGRVVFDGRPQDMNSQIRTQLYGTPSDGSDEGAPIATHSATRITA